MSSGYGRFGAALGGLILAFLLSGSGSAEGQSERNHQGGRSTSSQNSQPTADAIRHKPVVYAPSCNSPHSADEAAYCDQRRATVAAERAATWAERQFWISLAGTLGLIVTILYTAVATRAASRAAKAAEASLEDARADAAEQSRRFEAQLKVAIDAARAATIGAEAARVTSEAARDVERSYVFGGIEKMTVNKARTATTIYFHIVNMGRTPARVRQINIGQRDTGPLPEVPDFEYVEGHTADVVLKPGEDARVRVKTFNGTKGIVFGTIYYIDVFRQNHESRFCLEYDAVRKFCSTAGNEAWNRYT